ncbi:hypothetical protein NDU88_001674 [Pleurodeles waltl]|uniref:DBB domain-containing protein n=1 Tax=Pleurodeles waltl TaxID=8319 RepID=A0AAV7W1Q4_PLEWA|nr:hypothetical protein NDU88_001674 [Pleurodeles waltl]
MSRKSPEEIFVVLKEGTAFEEAIEIEFITNGQHFRIQPDVWNEKVLCMKAPDFPAGIVNVNVYCEGVIRATAEIEYYTAMGEIETLLRKAADPVNFICRAFNVNSPEKLDDILTSFLRSKMPEGEVSNFFDDAVNQNQDICQSGEYPTLLHCAAKFGFKNLTTLLTQCPGAVRAARMINGDGDDPASLAEKHGHEDLQQLIQKVSISSWENEYLEQGEEESEDENIYVSMHFASDPQSTMASSGERQEDLLEQGKEDEPDQEEGEEDEAGDEAEASSSNYRDSFDYANNIYDEIESKEDTMKEPNPFRYEKQPLHAPLLGAAPLMPEDVYVFSQEQSWKSKQDSEELWFEQEAYKYKEDDEDEEEDPYSLTNNSDLYDQILIPGQEENRKGRRSFIVNRPPAPAPRPPPSVIFTTESSTPFIAQVFQQKTTTKAQADEKDVYSLRQPVRPLGETYVTLEKHLSPPSGQEELILLQEKVKQGLMTMDEALEKFKQWQNEQSGSDQAQKEKLRQLRGCIIGNRPEEDYLYDKITIVHQPKAAAEKTRRATPAIDTVYAKLSKPQVPPRVPKERAQGNVKKLPKIK